MLASAPSTLSNESLRPTAIPRKPRSAALLRTAALSTNTVRPSRWRGRESMGPRCAALFGSASRAFFAASTNLPPLGGRVARGRSEFDRYVDSRNGFVWRAARVVTRQKMLASTGASIHEEQHRRSAILVLLVHRPVPCVVFRCVVPSPLGREGEVREGMNGPSSGARDHPMRNVRHWVTGACPPAARGPHAGAQPRVPSRCAVSANPSVLAPAYGTGAGERLPS